MSERFHNVYVIGRCPRSAAGLIPRADRDEAARVSLATGTMRRVGLWRVVDHTSTIEALCGPWGRCG